MLGILDEITQGSCDEPRINVSRRLHFMGAIGESWWTDGRRIMEIGSSCLKNYIEEYSVGSSA